MKFALLLISVIILIKGQTAPKVYNPLAVGNRWELKSSDDNSNYRMLIEITRDTIVNNKKYYKKVWNTFPPAYERYDTINMRTYGLDYKDLNNNKKFDDEILMDDFSGEPPYNLPSYRFETPGLLEATQVKTKISWFVFEKYRDGFHCRYSLWDMIVVENLGIVSFGGDGSMMNLSGAIINGVEYGNLVDNEPGIPSLPEYKIKNYPNPFGKAIPPGNPSTTIEFELNEGENVLLEVFDMTGKRVAVLLNEYKPAGVYKFNFNINDYNTGAESGIYIYRLKTKNHSFVKKMVLIK